MTPNPQHVDLTLRHLNVMAAPQTILQTGVYSEELLDQLIRTVAYHDGLGRYEAAEAVQAAVEGDIPFDYVALMDKLLGVYMTVPDNVSQNYFVGILESVFTAAAGNIDGAAAVAKIRDRMGGGFSSQHAAKLETALGLGEKVEERSGGLLSDADLLTVIGEKSNVSIEMKEGASLNRQEIVDGFLTILERDGGKEPDWQLVEAVAAIAEATADLDWDKLESFVLKNQDFLGGRANEIAGIIQHRRFSGREKQGLVTPEEQLTQYIQSFIGTVAFVRRNETYKKLKQLVEENPGLDLNAALRSYFEGNGFQWQELYSTNMASLSSLGDSFDAVLCDYIFDTIIAKWASSGWHNGPLSDTIAALKAFDEKSGRNLGLQPEIDKALSLVTKGSDDEKSLALEFISCALKKGERGVAPSKILPPVFEAFGGDNESVAKKALLVLDEYFQQMPGYVTPNIVQAVLSELMGEGKEVLRQNKAFDVVELLMSHHLLNDAAPLERQLREFILSEKVPSFVRERAITAYLVMGDAYPEVFRQKIEATFDLSEFEWAATPQEYAPQDFMFLQLFAQERSNPERFHADNYFDLLINDVVDVPKVFEVTASTLHALDTESYAYDQLVKLIIGLVTSKAEVLDPHLMLSSLEGVLHEITDPKETIEDVSPDFLWAVRYAFQAAPELVTDNLLHKYWQAAENLENPLWLRGNFQTLMAAALLARPDTMTSRYYGTLLRGFYTPGVNLVCRDVMYQCLASLPDKMRETLVKQLDPGRETELSVEFSTFYSRVTDDDHVPHMDYSEPNQDPIMLALADPEVSIHKRAEIARRHVGFSNETTLRSYHRQTQTILFHLSLLNLSAEQWDMEIVFKLCSAMGLENAYAEWVNVSVERMVNHVLAEGETLLAWKSWHHFDRDEKAIETRRVLDLINDHPDYRMDVKLHFDNDAYTMVGGTACGNIITLNEADAFQSYQRMLFVLVHELTHVRQSNLKRLLKANKLEKGTALFSQVALFLTGGNCLSSSKVGGIYKASAIETDANYVASAFTNQLTKHYIAESVKNSPYDKSAIPALYADHIAHTGAGDSRLVKAAKEGNPYAQHRYGQAAQLRGDIPMAAMLYIQSAHQGEFLDPIAVEGLGSASKIMDPALSDFITGALCSFASSHRLLAAQAAAKAAVEYGQRLLAAGHTAEGQKVLSTYFLAADKWLRVHKSASNEDCHVEACKVIERAAHNAIIAYVKSAGAKAPNIAAQQFDWGGFRKHSSSIYSLFLGVNSCRAADRHIQTLYFDRIWVSPSSSPYLRGVANEYISAAIDSDIKIPCAAFQRAAAAFSGGGCHDRR